MGGNFFKLENFFCLGLVFGKFSFILQKIREKAIFFFFPPPPPPPPPPPHTHTMHMQYVHTHRDTHAVHTHAHTKTHTHIHTQYLQTYTQDHGRLHQPWRWTLWLTRSCCTYLPAPGVVGGSYKAAWGRLPWGEGSSNNPTRNSLFKTISTHTHTQTCLHSFRHTHTHKQLPVSFLSHCIRDVINAPGFHTHAK